LDAHLYARHLTCLAPASSRFTSFATAPHKPRLAIERRLKTERKAVGWLFLLWFLLMNKQSFAGQPLRLAVTYRALADLIPDPRNARTHPKRQIDQLRASIEAFGFTNPILADPEGHIIAGHGRLLAARAIGC